jgi:hypothetical protein
MRSQYLWRVAVTIGKTDEAAASISNDAIGQAEEEGIEGFSQEHYGLLSSYVVVVETKIIALAGTSLTMAALLITFQPEASLALVLNNLSAFLFGISALLGILALYSPLRASGKGVIFWEDIQGRSTAAEYHADVQRTTPTALKQDFSTQNFYISKSLHYKYRMMRSCIIFLVLGLIVGFAAFVV